MRLLTYQMPDELLTVASAGEFDEFDLNEFFAATDGGKECAVQAQNDVQKWLDIIRGQYAPKIVDGSKRARAAVPLLGCAASAVLQHSFWFLPNVALSGDGELLAESTTSSGASTRLSWRPVRRRVSDWTRCLRCARPLAVVHVQNHHTVMRKLTTGVTVPQWSSI